MLAVIALGRVAFQRWADGITDVDPNTINRMRRMNVLTYAPTWSSKFLPLVEGAYAQRWPATSTKKPAK
jgi:hypothetical protein